MLLGIDNIGVREYYFYSIPSKYTNILGIMTDSAALADGFVCIKLKEEDPLTIGYIIRKDYRLSDVGEKYIEELNKYKEL